MNNEVENKIKALDSIQEYMNSNTIDILTIKDTPLFIEIGVSQISQVKRILATFTSSGDMSNIHDDIKITFNVIINEYKKLRGWQ